MKSFSCFQRILFFICFLETGFLNCVFAFNPWPDPPTVISTPQVNASSPSVAIDSNGRSVAVWIENGVVMSSQQPLQGTWASPPISISGSNASNPYVVVDSTGTITALWLQNGVVTTASQPLSGNWSSPQTLSASGATEASIAMDPNGNIVAVWSLAGAIQSMTHPVGGNWPSTPDVLAGSNGSFPAIAVGDGGDACVVWQQSDQTIHAISKSIGGSWGTAQQVSLNGVLTCYPAVTVTGEGDLIVAWFRYQISESQYQEVAIQSSHRLVGSSWDEPQDIGLSGPIDPSRLELVLSSGNSNTAVACWTSGCGESLFNAVWNIWEAGSWEGESPLVACNEMAYSIDVVGAPSGNAYISCMYRDPITGSVELLGVTLALPGLTRTGLVVWLLSRGGVNGYPILSVNRIGSTSYGVGAWENYDGNYNNIQVLSTTFPTVFPPTQASVIQETNNYGVFTQYNNVISWSPSPSPNIAGYIVERNGNFLALLMQSTFGYQYTDVNQSPSTPPSYGVYAFNQNGYISNPVTLQWNGSGWSVYER